MLLIVAGATGCAKAATVVKTGEKAKGSLVVTTEEEEEGAQAAGPMSLEDEDEPMTLNFTSLSKAELWPSASDNPPIEAEMGDDLRFISPPTPDPEQAGAPWRCRSCGARDLGVFSKRQFRILHTGKRLSNRRRNDDAAEMNPCVCVCVLLDRTSAV